MDELLDIVDENDIVVRRDLRSRVYGDGLTPDNFIRVVNILVFNGVGRLLLPKRSSNRRLFPNCYDFSCGEHVTAGENYSAAAKRGILEELNIVNPELEFLGKLGPVDGVSSFMQIFRIQSDDLISDYDKNGIQSLEWFWLSDIMKKINEESLLFKPDLLPVLKWYSTTFQ